MPQHFLPLDIKEIEFFYYKHVLFSEFFLSVCNPYFWESEGLTSIDIPLTFPFQLFSVSCFPEKDLER